MRFSLAIKRAEEGKKIFRKGDANTKHLHIEGDDLIRTYKNDTERKARLDFKAIRANDWGIYKE